MNFYKHFIGDYARDTGDLSIVEHGAYRLMLDHFYGTCRPLPTGKALYRLLRAESKADREAINTIALRFWLTLPEDLETIYELLDLQSEEEQNAYRLLANDWSTCGLINIRALKEALGAHALGERNRQIAREREQKRRREKDRGHK